MNRFRDPMKELLRMYHLDTPVPPEVRKYFLSRMGRVFSRVMKTTGSYSPIFGFFSFLYFLFKKLGVVIHLKMLLGIAIMTALLGGGIAGYFFLDTVKVPAQSDRTQQKIHRYPNALAKTEESSHRVRAAAAIIIEPLESGSVDKAVMTRLTNSLSDALNAVGGSSFSSIAVSCQSKYSLSGYVEKMEEKFIAFIRVVDNRNSSILFVTREKFESLDELEKGYSRFAGDIVTRVRGHGR